MRENDSADAVPEQRDVERNQEGERMFGRLQVRDHLSHVHFVELLDCLQLHHQITADQQVEPALTDSQALVLNEQPYLPLEWNTAAMELEGQCLFVHRLHESRPENAVHLDRRIDHFPARPSSLRPGSE